MQLVVEELGLYNNVPAGGEKQEDDPLALMNSHTHLHYSIYHPITPAEEGALAEL